MWVYAQASGNLYDPGGVIIAQGYSGNGPAKNNPGMEEIVDHGPIPCGLYVILTPEDSPKCGPYALPLQPDPGNRMYGRSAFRIHGDSIEFPGHASDGCIILPRAVREGIWDSQDRWIKVISGIGNDDEVQEALEP